MTHILKMVGSVLCFVHEVIAHVYNAISRLTDALPVLVNIIFYNHSQITQAGSDIHFLVASDQKYRDTCEYFCHE